MSSRIGGFPYQLWKQSKIIARVPLQPPSAVRESRQLLRCNALKGTPVLGASPRFPSTDTPQTEM